MSLPIQLFNYESLEVRTLTKEDGSVWFAAVDICKSLELSQVSRALSRLEEDEVTSINLTDSLGRNQETNLISESGLYSLVLSSKKPEAKKFKKWVTNEVIPSIRKTGSYKQEPKKNSFEIPRSLGDALLLAGKLAKENEQLIEQSKKDRPLAAFAQSQFNLIQKVPLSAFGKYLATKVKGMGPCRISSFLVEQKLLFKNRRGKIEPYSKYLSIDSNSQYFDLKERSFIKPVIRDGVKIGEEKATSFQTLIIKSGMEKVIELCYKAGLINDQQFYNITNDLPNFINHVENEPAHMMESA